MAGYCIIQQQQCVVITPQQQATCHFWLHDTPIMPVEKAAKITVFSFAKRSAPTKQAAYNSNRAYRVFSKAHIKHNKAFNMPLTCTDLISRYDVEDRR